MERRLVPVVLVGALATSLATALPAAAAEPPRPHERTLDWTCTDGTTFTAARPSSSANASPVVGSTQVWLQVETTITRPDGVVTVDTTGGGRANGLSGRLLDCTTTSGPNQVRVVGLLTG